jgi:hypothetical protein
MRLRHTINCIQIACTCRVVASKDSAPWSTIHRAVCALHDLLRFNDTRLEEQQERTAQLRAADSQKVPPGSHMVPGSPKPLDTRFEQLLDALTSAAMSPDDPSSIVHIKRTWFQNPDDALQTQRQHFKRAIEALLAGNVRSAHVTLHAEACRVL